MHCVQVDTRLGAQIHLHGGGPRAHRAELPSEGTRVRDGGAKQGAGMAASSRKRLLRWFCLFIDMLGRSIRTRRSCGSISLMWSDR